MKAEDFKQKIKKLSKKTGINYNIVSEDSNNDSIKEVVSRPSFKERNSVSLYLK